MSISGPDWPGADWIAALLRDIDGPLALAVSGGSDSTFLLHAALRIAGPGRIVVLTVDHRLRPESAGEAQEVAASCARLGLRHRIVDWLGPKPATGLMAAAREARHRLLADAARDAGAGTVLTGHTLDDQIETLTMRLARADRPGRGDAGIAPATLYDGRVWFARPLLDARRQVLRERLVAHGIGWRDDPSNENRRFERVRARQDLATLHADETDRLLVGQRAAALERIGQAGRIALLIERHASSPMPGLLRLDPAAFADAEAGLLIAILASLAGGGVHLMPAGRADGIAAKLAQAASGGQAIRMTAARAVFDLRRAGLFLHREARNLPDPGTVGDTIWDGRFRLPQTAISEGWIVGPWGRCATQMPEQAVPASIAKSVRASWPAMRDGEGGLQPLVGEASRRAAQARPAPGLWTRYLPSFDFAAAQAAARLLGCDALPPPPAGHKARPSLETT